MQRNNLKMCLRSTDSATDTSEVAKVCINMKQSWFFLFIYFLFNVGYLGLIVSKFSLYINVKAYGGGGSPSSSSFIIRMDEYNQWLSVNSS